MASSRESTKSRAKTGPCFKCQKSVDHRFALNGNCDTCERSFHAECISLTEVTLKELRAEGYPVYCDDCKHGCGKVMTAVKNLQKKVWKLEEADTDFEKRMKKLESNGGDESHGTISAVEEMLRRERSKTNLIIHGIEENEERNGDSDFKAAEEVIGMALGPTDIKPTFVKRVGKGKNGKTRPLLVKLGKDANKSTIVASWIKLKRGDSIPQRLKDVTVGDDLTKMQRENLSKLRVEADQVNNDRKDGKSALWPIQEAFHIFEPYPQRGNKNWLLEY